MTHEPFLISAAVLFVLGNFSQRLLLSHIRLTNRAWAEEMHLPVGGLTPFSLGELFRLYAVVLALHHKLMRDRYSAILTYVSWCGTVPALLMAVIGGLLIAAR